ncbi:MAG: MFS transporter, partial [Acidimicrobiia bacterium]
SGAYLGAAVMVITQMAMVAIMTMTPVHMRAHGHDIGDVGLVIGFHIGAMYLPSLVTGVLVDRFGRITMAVAAAVTLLAAGVTAATAPGESLPALVAALVLLGLGWNFGLISGTALVVDATSPEDRPRVQGTIDVGVALAGAGGGVLSGVIVAGSSYATLSLLGGVLSLAVIPVLWWTRRMEARHRAQRGLTVPG